MWNARTLTACAFGVVLLTPGLEAQERLAPGATGAPSAATYRNFALKSDLATVSSTAGVAASEAKMIHQRPAVLQDLEWRPSRWIAGSRGTSTHPVDAGRLDQLDAPRVELARQKKERDDRRVVAEKARAVNKAVFRP